MKARAVVALLLSMVIGVGVAAQGTEASVLAGIEAYNRGDITASFALLKSAADAGNADAQVNLGYLYARGQGVDVDQREAMRLYLLSAGQGNPEGMNAVGFKYRYGSGVPVDLPRAVHWFCRAAVSGDPRGLNNLANMYYDGKGVDRDLEEARRLWGQSADRGNPNAMFNLGQSLYFDQPVDRERATALFLEAARRGHGGAQKNMRQMGYRDALPPPVNTELEMRPARRDLRPGKVRDCGVLAS